MNPKAGGKKKGFDLLDDLLQLLVLSLQLAGLLLVMVVGGGAALYRLLSIRLPLPPCDEAPHLQDTCGILIDLF